MLIIATEKHVGRRTASVKDKEPHKRCFPKNCPPLWECSGFIYP